MNRPGHPPPNGFTLLEVMVALTLVSLLSTVLFQGLRLSARMQAAASARGERLLAVATIHASLRDMMAGAEAVVPDPAAPPPQPIVFRGGADRIAFVAPMPTRIGLGGPHLFSIGLDREDRVVMRWRLFRPETTPSAAGSVSGTGSAGQDRQSVLLEDVREVRFAYYAARGPEDPPAWYGQWQNARTLPLLIRVGFAFKDGSVTPDLLIAPRQAPASILASR